MTPNSKISKSRIDDMKILSSFLIDLSKLLKKHADINVEDLSLLSSLLHDNLSELSNPAKNLTNRYADNNKSKTSLVGVMPKLLQDETIFPKNEDLSKFALEIFGIVVTRYEKRSRYELIGFIVTGVLKLDEREVERLVDSIMRLIDNEATKKQLISKRETKGFSWFEYISESH